MNGLKTSDIDYDQTRIKPNLIEFHHRKNNQSYGTIANSAERGRKEEEIKVAQLEADG